MDQDNENGQPPRESRNSRDRRRSSTVPAAPLSSASDGLSAALTASAAEERAIADGDNTAAAAATMGTKMKEPVSLTSILDMEMSEDMPTSDQPSSASEEETYKVVTRRKRVMTEEPYSPSSPELQKVKERIVPRNQDNNASSFMEIPSEDEEDNRKIQNTQETQYKRVGGKMRKLTQIGEAGPSIMAQKGTQKEKQNGTQKGPWKKNTSPEKLVKQMEQRTTHDLAAIATAHVEELDTLRRKSSNLNGTVSGNMKTLARELKYMISELATRAQATGELSFLHMREAELERETKELRKENTVLKHKIEEINKELQRLKQDIHDGKTAANAAKKPKITNVENENIEIPSRREKDKFPALAPPLRGTRRNLSDNEIKHETNNIQRMLNKIASRFMGELYKLQKQLEQTPLKHQQGYKATTNITEKMEMPPPLAKPPPRRKNRDKKINNMLSTTEEDEIDNNLPPSSENEWQLVRKYQRRRLIQHRTADHLSTYADRAGAQLTKNSGYDRSQRRTQQNKVREGTRLRLPRTAAVAIRIQNDKVTYAEAMTKARQSIQLNDMNISDTRLRRDATGGLIIQIPGAEARGKALQLQDKLKKALGDIAKITVPSRKAELRVTGFDESVTADEITAAIAEKGNCSVEEVRVGKIRPTRSGLFTAWILCPLSAAHIIEAGGRIRLGWSSIRATLLPPRRLQCYRCFEYGHLQTACSNSVDRSKLCYKCGRLGHKAAECLNPPHCPVCATNNVDADHRIGSQRCAAAARNGTTNKETRGTIATEAVTVALPKTSGEEEEELTICKDAGRRTASTEEATMSEQC